MLEQCVISASLLLLVVRIAATVFAFYPLWVLSIAGRIGLVLGFVVLFLPALPAQTNCRSLLTAEVIPMPGLQSVIEQVALGVLTGLLLSAAAFALELAAQTLFRYLSPVSELGMEQREMLAPRRQTLRTALFLVLVISLFSGTYADSWLADVALSIGSSITAQQGADLLARAGQLSLSVGATSFKLGLILLLPFFIISLCLDLAFLVLSRFVRSIARPQLLTALRIPALVIALSVLVYPLAWRLHEQTASSARELSANTAAHGSSAKAIGKESPPNRNSQDGTQAVPGE